MNKCKILSEEEFNNYLNNQKYSSIFQSSAWSKTKTNWTPLYIGYTDDQYKIACMFLLRTLPFGFNFAYAPRGPITNFEISIFSTQLVDFFKEVNYLLSKNHVLLAKIDPNLIIGSLDLSDKKNVSTIENKNLVTLFKKSGAHHNGYPLHIKSSIQPRIQLGFPIDEKWEERIPNKTMKKIRSSYKKGIIIKEESNSTSLVKMVQCTERRHNIHLRNATYFDQILTSFKDNACVLSAYYDDTLISACLLVKCATTTEILYSGYDDKYKQYNSTYPLRYESILWAKKHGCSLFNFGGVEGTLDDGLTMFKSSFNPLINVYIGEFDLLPIPLLSHLVSFVYPLLKKYVK